LLLDAAVAELDLDNDGDEDPLDDGCAESVDTNAANTGSKVETSAI
jgi:hypothetical protein